MTRMSIGTFSIVFLLERVLRRNYNWGWAIKGRWGLVIGSETKYCITSLWCANAWCGKASSWSSLNLCGVVEPCGPAVLGTPLLTLFAALWLHESDTWLLAPTVSQFAFCLVSCFRILESANTDCTFAVNIPVTNTVVNRINTISSYIEDIFCSPMSFPLGSAAVVLH